MTEVKLFKDLTEGEVLIISGRKYIFNCWKDTEMEFYSVRDVTKKQFFTPQIQERIIERKKDGWILINPDK